MKTSNEERLSRIFFKYAHSKIDDVRAENTRFVHYTNAEAALSILKNREVWMRNSTCMNDFMEVRHGWNCLNASYQKLKPILEDIYSGLSTEIEKLFDGWTPHFLTSTYLTCISEHEDYEDNIGRLSMWRAYSENTGVALVLNNSSFLSESDALKIYTSPVAYLNDREFGEMVDQFIENIKKEIQFIKEQPREVIKAHFFHMMRFAILSTKHPGFREEKEWRVIYSPTYEGSDYLTNCIEVIGGSPQTIYKIPLKDVPEKGLFGVEIPSLINRIIIGPTQYSTAVWEAFVKILGATGATNPDKMVFVSDIPLRR